MVTSIRAATHNIKSTQRVMFGTQSAGQQFLQITGVYPEECTTAQELMETELMDHQDDSADMDNAYVVPLCSKLPEVYKGNDSWPKNSHLRCVHCTLPCTSSPVFLPNNLRVQHGEPLVGRYGPFIMNSFPCAKAYLDGLTMRFDQRINMTLMLKELYFMFTGMRVDKIPSAGDPRELLAAYGKGNMTQEQYLIDLAIQMRSGNE